MTTAKWQNYSQLDIITVSEVCKAKLIENDLQPISMSPKISSVGINNWICVLDEIDALMEFSTGCSMVLKAW